MASRTIRFAAIPAIPQAGLTNWQGSVLSALKENVELLTGARRGGGTSGQAVYRGQVSVSSPASQKMTRTSAQGTGYTISDVTVPSLDDYTKLLSDVQTLADDVAALRATVNTLITQLKG
jgi:hypothetical protein